MAQLGPSKIYGDLTVTGEIKGNTSSASVATQLETARTINGTSFNGSSNITTANWGTTRTITVGSTGKSVNGSANVSWSLAEIGAAASSHTHSYLPLSGGTLTGGIDINSASPTINLRDTDSNSAFIHCNSNFFYILRGGNNATTWTQVNGQWPLLLNLTNNDATFGGNVAASGNITAYSDTRLKENLEVIPSALDKVSALTGYTFNRKDIDGKRQTGIIAQDLQKVLPEAVIEGTDDNKTLSVAYGNLAGLFVEAIKELKAEIEELKRSR